MTPRLSGLLLAFLCCATLGRAAVAAPAADEQRQQYHAALAALRAGDPARFQKLRDGLDGYALQPYLDYEFLKDRVASTPAVRLHEFLDRNPEAAVSDSLRHADLARHILARLHRRRRSKSRRKSRSDADLA